MAIKVILDTDIGSDIDDAVALAYLLRQSDCDLLGITTVTGEPVKRAEIASAICRAAGRDIPIYPGAEQPLEIEQKQPRAPQAAALPNWSHETKFPEGAAIEFLRRTIRANPGEVVLLTIAPLTNIAQLFQADPEIPHLLREVVTMGGIFTPLSGFEGKAEWNIALDPLAAQIVYRAPVRRHRSVGLDVTLQVVLSEAEIRARFTSPILKPVLDFAEVWFKQPVPVITFHDPLTAAVIFDDSLCVFESGDVLVDLDEVPGATHFQPGTVNARHQIALTVNAPRYFEHFFSVTG